MHDKLKITYKDGTVSEVDPVKPWSPCTCCPQCQEKLKMLPGLILQNGRLAQEKFQQAAKIEQLKELHEMASQDVLNGIDIINRKDAKIERLKEELVAKDKVIAEVHHLSYPGLAVNEGTLLNRIYRLTMVDEPVNVEKE